jgi:hypothetical protein
MGSEVCELFSTQFCGSESIIINLKYKNKRLHIINQLLRENDKAKIIHWLIYLINIYCK